MGSDVVIKDVDGKLYRKLHGKKPHFFSKRWAENGTSTILRVMTTYGPFCPSRKP